MSVKSKNQKLERMPGRNEISTLPPKPLTPEQEEKVKGGLASSQERNGDGDGIQGN